MNRTAALMRKLLAGAALLYLALPVTSLAQDETKVVSDSTWYVYKPDPVDPSKQTFLGLSQNVCLNSMAPSNCPLGITPPPTLWGWMGSGWAANLSSLPVGARWMWVPNVTKDTPFDLTEFTFEKTAIYVCDAPVDSTISIAADDSVSEVSINGTVLPNSNTVGADALKAFNVPASLIQASSPDITNPHFGLHDNTITVKAKDLPGGTGCNTYNCNPAGVVLGGGLKSTVYPTCKSFVNGPDVKNGQEEKISDCAAGQTGSVTHTCACGTWLPDQNSCVTPPQCQGVVDTTKFFNVNDQEFQSCPAGQIAPPLCPIRA